MKYEWKAEKRRMRIQQAMVILLVLLCILGSKYLKTIPGNTVDNWQTQTKKGRNDKSFHELVADLASLGLTEVTDEQLSTVEMSWDSMPEEFRDNTEKLPMLLTLLGSGNYDYDTWEWTPSSNCIYSFDVEVFDCSNMYTNFLEGIKAISNQEFSITDVVETVSNEDYDKGTGTQTVQFKYNGNMYTYDAELEYDWFDLGMINFMNQMLKKEQNPKRLYYMSDGMQECIIFYCTPDWAIEFKNVTGYKLESKVH